MLTWAIAYICTHEGMEPISVLLIPAMLLDVAIAFLIIIPFLHN